jgi:hypothetical protein
VKVTLMVRRSLALAALLATLPAQAFERSPQEIRQQRQASIDGILSDDPATDVAIDRGNCMNGRMPSITRMSRKNDGGISANAADLCVAVLVRTGRDGTLVPAYSEIVTRNGGDAARASSLPDAIGGAIITERSDSVPLGNGKAIRIKPAMAFDAGFSAAYLKGETKSAGMPDLVTLKAISEKCLDQTEANLGLCYATGYAHAVRATNGEAIVAD